MAAPPPVSSHSAADSSVKKTFVIGTRQSKLALLQTNLVLAALKEKWPEYSFEILSKETAGDLNTTIALREFNSKNLWTEELEQLLIAGDVDIIVHSLKGMLSVLAFLVMIANICDYRCPNPHSPFVYFGPDDETRGLKRCPGHEERPSPYETVGSSVWLSCRNILCSTYCAISPDISPLEDHGCSR